MQLEPTALIFALHSGSEFSWKTYRGEVRVDIDSAETAFVTPCNRIEMTEEVQQLIREKIEPLGVVYMRWWVDGRLVGRSFEGAL